MQIHCEQKQRTKGFQISQFMQNVITLVSIIEILTILIVTSLSLVFREITQTNTYKYFLIFGVSYSMLSILKKLLLVKHFDGKKLESLLNIFQTYLDQQGFRDLIVIFVYILQIVLQPSSMASVVSRFLLILKCGPLFIKLQKLQHVFIQNAYMQQIWQMTKVFILNYLFAHFLSVLLISISKINPSQNWMINKGIYHQKAATQYIWSYYWAINIMLTVGFGDIVPSNSTQALCMIFIQTIGCTILAYNINCVGTIIAKLRSYSLQKSINMRAFAQINKQKKVSQQLSNRIYNYIKQSVQIKSNHNIEQQNEFVQALPTLFWQDLLKQINQSIWQNLLFFKNLSQKTIIQLSVKIKKKLAHPEEIIYYNTNQIDILILGKGSISQLYNKSHKSLLSSNNKVVRNYKIQQFKYKLASLNFIFNKGFGFNIQSSDYTIFYQMSKQVLLSVLQDNLYDYEYYYMMKDKDSYLLNQFEIDKCDICEKQKHSLDNCPRLHYLPIKQHIVDKYLTFKLSQTLMNKLKNCKRKVYHKIKPLISYNQIIKEALKLRKQEIWQKCYQGADGGTIQQKIQFLNYSDRQIYQDSLFVYSEDKDNFLNFAKMASMAADKLKNEVEKLISGTSTLQSFWDLECDVLYDFKYYFKLQNPQKISISLKKNPLQGLISSEKIMIHQFNISIRVQNIYQL